MPPQRHSDYTELPRLPEEQHAHFATDQMAPMEPVQRPHTIRSKSFIKEFTSSNGPPQIICVIMLLAMGFGSTIGVVPAVMTDRYARLNHGYMGETFCSDYVMQDKPRACLDGSADAQSAVAMEQMISNALTFFTSSLVGSISDEHGRKWILVLGVMLASLSPLFLLLVQMHPEMSPFWYYGAGAITGLINWIAVALSSLSDVMPPRWRAPSFGLVMAGFSVGFALAPQLALLLGHWNVSVYALACVWMSLFIMIVFFPETLPASTAAHARVVREEMVEGLSGMKLILWNIYRPMWELSILNRSTLFRLLSLLAFFSGMVTAGDRTLLLYYLEERLAFTDKDIAIMFSIMGFLGIFVQGFLLKIINDMLGERKVIMLAFSLGVVHNVMYGLATNKTTIFISISIAAFVNMSFPAISAMKANNVEESEQGRIQGALYSVQALASAAGPMVLRAIYGFTKDGALLGPGSMFIFASAFYVVAVYCACLLPREADSKREENEKDDREFSVESPLI